MKKLCLLFALLAITVTANATHLMGGEIVVSKQPSGLYKITLSYYRDTLGIPLSGTEVVDVFATGGPMSGGFGMMYPSLTLKYDSVLSQLLVPSFPYGVEAGIYVKDSVALPGGYYKIISNTCCRNGAILNCSAPLSESLVLSTDVYIPSTGNSSPRFLAMPIANFAVNTTTTYNPLPNDPDADSISWDFNTPMGTYSGTPPSMLPVAGFGSLPSTSAFTMNPVTGEITWTPTVTGNFIQSFKVNEYKNGALSGVTIRDMQYVVLAQDTTNPPPNFAMLSSYLTNTQQGYYYNYYTPGQPYTFQIKGTSTGTAANLVMTSFGEPYTMSNPANFTVTGSGNNITGTFHWTPPTTLARDIIVSFRVGNGVFTKDFTLLLRKNSSNDVKNTAAAVNEFTVYPNPASNEVNVSMDIASSITGDVSIYNTLGQQVKIIYNGQLNKGAIRMNSKLNLAAGTYFVILRNGDGILKTQPITVQ